MQAIELDDERRNLLVRHRELVAKRNRAQEEIDTVVALLRDYDRQRAALERAGMLIGG